MRISVIGVVAAFSWLAKRAPGKRAGRNAVSALHPEAIEGFRLDVDRGEVLHPIGRGPAGHDQARGRAVPVGQRLAVHLERDQRVLVERAVDGQALGEIRRGGQSCSVSAIEHDLERIALHAGTIEHVPKSDAAPEGVAHRAVGPLNAGGTRCEQAAAIARALIDGSKPDALEVPLQFIERQLQRALHARAADPQAPRACIDFRDRCEVIAHEESVVRGELRAQLRERRFIVRRSESALDERSLAR